MTIEAVVSMAAQEAIRARCFHPSGAFTPFPEITFDSSVPQRFEEIVRKYPERIAIETSAQRISYNEVNKIANRLANYLVAQRSLEREPVALYIDDAISAIAAHIGVLKAGKISLFIDPSDSPSRINHILENAQPTVVVAKGDPFLRPTASNSEKGRLVHLDLDSLSPERSDDDLGLTIHPDAPAYIRYTSGSTGRAKGAIKTHRHLLHSVHTHTHYFHLSENDRFAIIGRNYLGKRTFEALLNGATLYPFDIKRSGLHRLGEWLIEKEITTCKFFPTAFRHFISTLSGKMAFAHLRLIQLEGEPVYQRDVDLYKAYFSSECVLVNSYSSTETGPISFCFIDKDSQFASRVPIGYPIKTIEIQLMDEVGEPVGANEPGEIVVKSEFLSTGYWRHSDTDCARSRWQGDGVHGFAYFTGDLGSMSDGGCLEHLGRKDSQVKVRSFRVDIGEVEAALAGHPGIKHAAVTTKQGLAEEARLVAYIIPSSREAPSFSQLRNYLAEILPDYMVPNAITVLEEFPLTSTGKIDYRALPDPAGDRPDLNTPFVAPRTEVEEKLTSIWSAMLGINRIGVHDNFFDLGGHSLTATRIVSEIFKKFRLQLSLQSLFLAPNVAQMASIISGRPGKPLDENELERMLADIESLSDNDAKTLLADQNGNTSNDRLD